MFNISLRWWTGKSCWRQKTRNSTCRLNPRMIHNLIYSRSSCRIIIKNFLNKIASVIRNLYSVRKIVIIHSNSSISGLNVISFKWWFSNNKGVNNHTDRPNIHFIRMSLFSFKNLWSDIIWSTTYRTFTFTIIFELCGKTEVTNFYFHLIIQE